jgi:hypothetical protein
MGIPGISYAPLSTPNRKADCIIIISISPGAVNQACRLLVGPQRLLNMKEVRLPLSVLFVSAKCDPYNQCGPIGCAMITSYPHP